MTFPLEDTIAAIATASGGALRGIIRMSGPQAVDVAVRCLADDAAVQRLSELHAPTVVPAEFVLDANSSRLPCALYVWPTDRSYTRQPLVEVHTLGSPPLLDAALRALCVAGARLAAPGEFTLRAFLGGRLDLAQAEAVLGVIDAQDRRMLDVALAQLAGGLTRPLTALGESLLELLADLEAGLDFVDEDIAFVSPAEVESRLAAAASVVSDIARQLGSRGHRGPSPRVVLAGPPNAGKSSLFNALCGGAAIVSPIAGTTRDALAARVEFGDIECELIDTAGLAEQRDGIQDSGFGIRGEADEAASADASIAAAALLQARARISGADIAIWCIDATQRDCDSWFPADTTGVESIDRPRIFVLTKIDAVTFPIPEFRIPNPPAPRSPCPAPLPTSSHTGSGLAELRVAIAAAVAASTHAESSVVAATAVRCQESLRMAGESIHRARHLAAEHSGDELVAAELRLALAELGKIVGAVYTDDILDRLFSRFCIGK